MRSRSKSRQAECLSYQWLLFKEMRELAAAKAWWILLLAMGWGSVYALWHAG